MHRRKLSEVIVLPSATIREAAQVIDHAGVRGVFVCEENRELLGILMDTELRRAILKNIDLNTSVRTVMNPSPFVIKQGLPLEERLHEVGKSGKLLAPVVDEQHRVVDYCYNSNIFTDFDRPRNTASDQGLPPGSTVLIIGGAGYIGTMLAEQLLEKGFKLRIFDMLIYDKTPITRLEGRDGVTFIRGDCRDIGLLETVMDGVDAVVHLGEIVGDPACAINEDFTISTNYMATREIVDLCLRWNISRFVFTSSCSVYGQNDEVVNEQSELNPVSLYARCKIECERAILQASPQGFCPTILRLSTVHGYSYRQRFDLVVNLLVAKGMTEKKIQIFGGEQWRPFLSVHDVCRGIIKVLEAPRIKVCQGIFNLGDSRENYTISQVGAIVGEMLPGVEVEHRPEEADTRNYRVSFERIQKTLGFTCEQTVRDTITKLTEAFENNEFEDYNDPKYHNVKSLKEQ